MPRRPSTTTKRPRITPEAEQDIRARLRAGRTPQQIYDAVRGTGEMSDGVSLSSLYRLSLVVEGEMRAERRAAAVTIAKLLAKEGSLSKQAISKLVYTATGELLQPKDTS